MDEYRNGDVVLVRGTVTGVPYYPRVDLSPGESLSIARADIVRVEKFAFAPGDRVCAEGHNGKILALSPGDASPQVAWVQPDDGRRPWTVNIDEIRRLAIVAADEATARDIEEPAPVPEAAE